jgi:hypothetical protein
MHIYTQVKGNILLFNDTTRLGQTCVHGTSLTEESTWIVLSIHDCVTLPQPILYDHCILYFCLVKYNIYLRLKASTGLHYIPWLRNVGGSFIHLTYPWHIFFYQQTPSWLFFLPADPPPGIFFLFQESELLGVCDSIGWQLFMTVSHLSGPLCLIMWGQVD